MEQHDAVFLPGDHGIVYDGPPSHDMKSVVEAFVAADKVVSAVCHGPAGLVSITCPDGKSIFAGKKVWLNNSEPSKCVLTHPPCRWPGSQTRRRQQSARCLLLCPFCSRYSSPAFPLFPLWAVCSSLVGMPTSTWHWCCRTVSRNWAAFTRRSMIGTLLQ